MNRSRVSSRSPGDVAARYDNVYARSLATPDGELSMSLNRLFANYGVLDPLRDRNSERLPIALQMLDFEQLTGKAILDYGCGSAKAAVVFAQAGATVYGFDASFNSIRTGLRRTRVNDVDRQVHLSVMAADTLGFPSESFDYVFGYEILYYLRGAAFAGEIVRVLKPGGCAVFCEALDGNPVLRWIRTGLRQATRTINRTGGRPLTTEQIDRLFAAHARVDLYPVNLLGMGKRLFVRSNVLSRNVVALLKQLDRYCLVRLPRLRRWCGEVVIVVRKPVQA